MSTRSKLIVEQRAALGLASPAFAQSFNRSDGTGNELRLTMTAKADCTPASLPYSKI
jgi:hypothetical protein